MNSGEHHEGGAEGARPSLGGMSPSQWALALVAGGAVFVLAYVFMPSADHPAPSMPAPPASQVVEAKQPTLAERIQATEALTKRLSKRLSAFSKATLAEPPASAGFFVRDTRGSSLIAPSTLTGAVATDEVRVDAWSVGEATSTAESWIDGYLNQVDKLEVVHLEIESGTFKGEGELVAESLVHLELVGVTAAGQTLGGVGQVVFDWRRSDAAESSPWRINGWRFDRFYTVMAPKPLFVDALPQMVDASTRQALERSEHAEKLLAILEHGAERQPEHPFAYDSLDRHPGLAVVDINRDGWDDLYVMPRWGTNQLLINEGGERFVEAAQAWGLDLTDSCSSAIFADFDNDGDADVIIGRTLKPSVYLVQEAGRFEAAPDRVGGGEFPKLVSSVSVVDYDADGLLDVYFSTYAATMVMQNRRWLAENGQLGRSALRGFLPAADAIKLGERMASADYAEQLNRPGPPNRLYRNTGQGNFQRVDSPLDVFCSTFQATWSDVDGDGDADVYLANDHSANHLFRNDSGEFVDITEETGTADFGFGMGVSWGDYDNDGRFDLYTSNMYSRAGRRLTGVLPELDPRLRRAARGNTLFRNAAKGFLKTSALDSAGLEVERAGWAWGAQFGDLNNDGFEDLYVLNRHYSAPEKVAIDHDS